MPENLAAGGRRDLRKKAKQSTSLNLGTRAWECEREGGGGGGLHLQC